jgi:hypothetical protein
LKDDGSQEDDANETPTITSRRAVVEKNRVSFNINKLIIERNLF